MRYLTILSVLILASCGAESQPRVTGDPVPLVDNAAWSVVISDEALFGASEGAVYCDGDQVFSETEFDGKLWLIIHTRDCNRTTLTQPLLQALNEGDTVSLRFWHFRINEGAGEYRLAVALGDPGAIAWEQSGPRPEQSGLIQAIFTADRDYLAGEAVTFHMSNHGVNDWCIVDINRL